MIIPKVILRRELIDHARTMLTRGEFRPEAGKLQNSARTQRRTYEFGYRYADMLNGDFSLTPIPDFLHDICAAAVKRLQGVANETLPRPRDFKNCIISIYEAGFRLQPHIDVDTRRMPTSEGKNPAFHFGNKIVGVVIKSDSQGGLYLLSATTRQELERPDLTREPIGEVDGLAYLLNGPNRNRAHGVSTVKKGRISATFRTVHLGP